MFTSDSLQKPYLSPCLTKKVSTVQYEEQSGESSPHFHITGGPGVLFQIHKVDPCNENEVQQRSHNWPWKMAAAFTQSHPWIVRKPDLAFNFQWNAWAWNIKKILLATRTWTFRVSHASAPGLEFKSDFQHLLLRDKSFVSLPTYLVRTPAKFSEFLEPYVTESNQTWLSRLLNTQMPPKFNM